MLATLFAVAFLANGLYLLSLRDFQKELQMRASDYWVEIGSPRGFSARDGMAVLRQLFSSRISDVCEGIGARNLLFRVRLVFGVGCVATAAVFVLGIMAQRA